VTTRLLPTPLSGLALLLALYLLAPFAAGLTQLGMADWRSVDWNTLGEACAVSLVSATLATMLVTLGGVPLGALLARTRGRRMAALGFLVQLPLALPPLSSGVLLLFLLGYASPLGRLTGGALTDSFAGIVLSEAFVAAPFLIIAARTAFAALDPVLEDVAATLGHRPWGIFIRVLLPLAWRPVLAGMLLTWLRAFGEFGATVMVAYHPYSLPVYTYVAFGSQGLPAMLPVLLPTLAAAVAVMALSTVVAASHRRSSSHGSFRRQLSRRWSFRRRSSSHGSFRPAQAAPAAERLRTQPAEPLRTQPVEPLRTQPGPQPLSAQPAAGPLSTQPGPEPLAAQPAAAPLALTPARPDRSPQRNRSVSFAFHRPLDGFALDAAWRTQAPRLAILGASGSGKSLTLRLIAGLDRVPGGTLSLAGRDLSAIPPEQRGIAYVPQNYGLFPHLTVARQVAFAVDSDPERARHWLDRLGLAGLEHRLPAELSLGQQQRVALARAFSRRAGMLLLDEPFSALDAPLRTRLRREFRALQREVDATTILVTHDPEEAFLLADELLLLDAGRVVQAGPVDAVFGRPANEAAARLLGTETLAAGWADGYGIDVGEDVLVVVAGPALPRGARVGWSVRPDCVRIGSEGDYPATIVDVGAPFAGRREVTLRLGRCLLCAALEPGAPASPGPCRVSIDPAAVQVWVAEGDGAAPASSGQFAQTAEDVASM
jgi:ABC-type Fe3+/spermidine/putrescine transport system ATPase subunit/ABC-type sulfate transport system permease component